jgi:hypothetical protein
MSRDPVSPTAYWDSALRTFSRPWPILLAGLGLTVVGLLFAQTPYVPARVIFLGAGLLVAGIAVSRRLQTAEWELEDRAESAGVLALSAFVALLAFLAMDENWDSGRLFLGVLIALALIASFLVLLPRPARRIAAVVLLVLHFGGILTAVTSVPPRNESPPWLSMQLWVHFYRHYLTFAYFTNAYHFYSPDPGPPTLLWFYVKYEDDTSRWVKIPNRRESPVGLHHQRMLATTESTQNPMPPLANDDEIRNWEERFKRPYEILPGIRHDNFGTIVMRRRYGAQLPYSKPIQLVDDESPMAQYSEPQEIARRLLASYARHVARTSPNPEDPKVAVRYVRVYRLTHNLISPRELAAGSDPLDPIYYTAFYMGKYDRDGVLQDGGDEVDANGRVLRHHPKDPFLYWYLPIMRVPERYPEGAALKAHEFQPGPYMLLDCVEIHANETDKVLKQEE